MRLLHFTFLIALLNLAGCASIMDSASQKMASNLSKAISNNNDPETIREALPTYLVLIDSLVEGDPDNSKTRMSAAKLYSTYSANFVADPERAQRLSDTALAHASSALCTDIEALCDIRTTDLDALKLQLDNIQDEAQLPVLYGFATAWAGWIKTHSGDWNSIAEIPRLTALLQRCVSLDETYDFGNAHLYLGVLNSQLPPALGGKPEIGRQHFERAIAISADKNLMAKVLFAEYYARLMFDQALHDRLLKAVLSDDQAHNGFILVNSLAKQRATILLAESADFF